jgi:hypothetical protein
MVPYLMVIAIGLATVTAPLSDCHAQEVTVHELWATKGTVELLEFGTIDGMAEAPDGSIWLSDGQSQIIVRLTADGVPTSVIARSGDGPGEFRAPHRIVRTHDDEMAVFDIRRRSVEWFDGAGTFTRRTALEGMLSNPKGFGVLPNGDVLLSGGSFTNDRALHRFGADGKSIMSWFPIPRPRVEPQSRISQVNARQVAGGPVFVLAEGIILYSNAAPHHIIRFAPGDTVGVTITSDTELLDDIVDEFEVERIRDGHTVISPRWSFSQSRGIFVLPDGVVLNIVTFEDEDRSLWELYSAGGNRRRVDVGRSYWPWNVTRSGDILAHYRDPDTDEYVATRLAISYR